MEKGFSSEKFAEIYWTYYKKCYSFAKSYVHDQYVAEDIASDVLIKLYEKLQNDDIDNIPAYLLTLLKNDSLDYLRKKTVRDRAQQDYIDADTEELRFRIATLEEFDPHLLFSKEIEDIIAATLKQLSPQSRKIFIMSRFKNFTNKEIAKKSGISVKGVEYHITKSLNLFRKNLKDYLPLFYFLFIS